MAEWELRPLSLGEILDRTFSLYRKHFMLFLGITAIPHLLPLVLNFMQILFTGPLANLGRTQSLKAGSGEIILLGIVTPLLSALVTVIAYLFSQGATVYAVSDLYLGRPTTIGESLRKMWGQLANLFGVTILNGFAILVSLLAFIIPGIYVACRLVTCIPAALLEDLGARSSLERSWTLTKDYAGRSFLIYVLYLAMLYGIITLFAIPFTIMIAAAPKDPSVLRMSTMLLQIGTFIAQVLVGPFFLIAISVFYYDLRVKKEAFDLQMMINPLGAHTGGSNSSGMPSMLS
jgi:Membrane domain of glycerophosphoryl diester phosphodiesterase